MNQPSIGTVIGGMRLEAVAGSGGMGTVYRARDLALDRIVALKIISPQHARDAEFRERFRREARLAAALDHPHVVPVLRAGDDDGFLYLSMRFVAGTDLAKLIRRGPIPDRDAVEIVAQVASALDAAHTRGLVHRDVKPANILMTQQDGRPYAYLTDFGITKDLSETGLTQTGMAIGTVDYMSPEQATERVYDGRADEYSLACVLFQLLTGRVPYPAPTPIARLHAHVASPVPDLRSIRPDLPAALAEAVRRGMAKRPDDRYPTCGEFAAAARAALPDAAAFVSSSTGGTTNGVAVTSPRTVGRRGVVLGAAGVGLLGVAGGGLYLRSRADDRHDPRPRAASARLVGKPIQLDSEPITADGDDEWLWVAGGESSTIIQIDVKTQRVNRTVSTGAGVPSWLGVARDKVWVWSYSTAFATYDRVSGQKDGSTEGADLVRVDEQMRAFAVDDPYLWFTVPGKNSIGRVDMRTRQAVTPLISVGSRPIAIDADDGQVHVVVADGPTLITVDADSGKEAERVSLPRGIYWVGAIGRTRFVATRKSVARITSTTLSEKDMVKTGAYALVLPVKGGAWSLDTREQQIQRLKEDLRTPIGGPLSGMPDGGIWMNQLGRSVWLGDRTANQLFQVQPTSDDGRT